MAKLNSTQWNENAQNVTNSGDRISMNIKDWVRFHKTIIPFWNPASVSDDVTAAEAPASTCLDWAIKVVNFLLCLIFQYTFEWLHCSFMAHRINFLDVIHDLTVTQPDKIEKYFPTSRIKKGKRWCEYLHITMSE